MIGGAMLAFILGDLLSSGEFLTKGSPTEVGEIAGNTIDGRIFEAKVQETIEAYKGQTGQTNLDAATTDQLREQTWNQMVRDYVLNQELDELGVTVSSDELYDMVQGSNPHPQITQAFTNPQTGQFDPAQVLGFLKRMETDEKMKKQWLSFEANIASLRRAEKYNNLIKKGLFITSAEAEDDYRAKSEEATIKYVLKRYDSVADSTVEVTDGDIKKYYNDHKSKYEQDASRDVEFVVFPVSPSAEDFEKVQVWANRLQQEFIDTDNDTILVNRESDVRFNPQWLPKGELPANIDSIMFAAKKGYVEGPYLDGETFRMAKLIGIKMAPDSVEARHILLTPNTYGSPEKTKAAADSIKELIENGADFGLTALQISEDPGSGREGGELGWFKEGQMVPAFNDACFNGKKGDLVVVESRFGAHIINVMNQKGKTEKRAVAFISRKVDPSTKTFQVKYGEADEFARSITSLPSFDQEVASRGLNKRIASSLKENDRTVVGLENPRELIRWAFKEEKEAISDVFEFGNSFVVAALTEVREEGFAEIDDVRAELEEGARKEKKAEMFIEEMSAAGAGDIQTVATNLNLPVEAKESIHFSDPSVAGLGRELEVLGTVGGMQVGDVSKPIKGNQGVYVLYLDTKSEAGKLQNYTNSAAILNSSLSSRVDYEV
ncbi:peptidylprolyl isomerase, partial [Bacteroidota bacterium]